MRRINFRRGAVQLVVAFFVFLALAQNPVNLELVSFKVVAHKSESGRLIEELKPAVKVFPGDVLEWRLRAKNNSKIIIKNVSLIIPIPAETYYLKNSASVLQVKHGDQEITIRPSFSYDGGHTFARPPLFKEVRRVVNGKEVVKEIPVPPEEYTHARWVLEEMLPGETVEVFLRTVVR